MTRPFTIAGGTDTTPVPKSVAEQIADLQAEARALAAADAEAFAADATALAGRAEYIATCTAFEVGEREVARKLALDLKAASQSLEVIRGRQDRSTK